MDCPRQTLRSSRPRIPHLCRANSIVASWNPRQRPKKGTLFSRANWIASILPFDPPLPEAAGDQDAIVVLERTVFVPLGIEPDDLHLGRKSPSRVLERFLDADVHVLDPVLTHDPDRNPARVFLCHRAGTTRDRSPAFRGQGGWRGHRQYPPFPSPWEPRRCRVRSRPR